MRRAARALRLAAAALCLCAAAAGAAEVFIDISRKRSEHIKLAVPEFWFKPNKLKAADDGQAGKTAKETLDFDLVFSGYFSILQDEKIFAEIKEMEKDATAWNLWNDAGVNALAKGVYYAIPGGQMAVECRLYDVDRQEQLAGTRYTGTNNIFRKMVHKFADQVIYRFTGEAGVADSRIVFAGRVGGNKELFLMDYDGQNVKQITNIKSIILSPEWSPFGTRLLFTSFHNRWPAAFTLDLRSGAVKPLVASPGKTQSAAVYSPDGKRIAYTMTVDGNSDIYTISTDGSGLTRLTHSESIETSPSWSPDGKQIAYVSDIPGRPHIYIMNADGTNPRRFTFNGDYNADPAWSPKGDRIAYASMMDWTFNIVVKNLDGSLEKQVTADNGKNESPSWSADGRHLVFSSTRSGERQIYIMNASGENQIQVTNMPGGAYAPSWSPRN